MMAWLRTVYAAMTYFNISIGYYPTSAYFFDSTAISNSQIVMYATKPQKIAAFEKSASLASERTVQITTKVQTQVRRRAA